MPTARPAPKEAVSKPSFSGRVLEFIILTSNLCGSSPFPFPIIALFAFGGPYLIRFVKRETPSVVISGLVLISSYYIFVGLYRLLVYNRYLDPLLAIPGPKGHWVRGVRQIIRDSETAVPQRSWIKEYDNPTGIISYSTLGARRIVPYSPAALSFFLNSPNYIKPPRASNFIKILIGDGIITAEYDAHKRQRRILTPAFGVSHIRQITPHFWTKAYQLAEAWVPVVENQPQEGIDVASWMNRVTLDIIGLAGFGFDFNSVQSENQPVALTYRRLFQPSIATRLVVLLGYLFPPFKLLPFPANRRLEKARKTIRDTALKMIRLKQEQIVDKEGRGERDIVGVMIEENRKNRENGIPHDALTEEEMVNQVMTFLAAGHETTSTSLAWALYLLSIHPEVQERLRKEVQSLDLDNSPSFEQLESLKYLNNVCREVLRFIPPVAMTVRRADEDDVYNGIKIPSGTPVFIAAGVNNFDRRTWGEDAEEFNPDRWDSLPETISNYSFLTFLQGTRSCIGRKFSETEMKCLLAVLVGHYSFEEVEPGRVVEKEAVLTVRPKGGMPLRIRKI